ncbi:hypothetical protein LTS18_010004 [Coniosporium uncinatum]|uniref:Uncharacterized protein n=1 Tax=Coniosporium uncinatum TaxID=93489 RepID=A0ACC3DLX8_9PEZI|nr:hypothetical protein LTS18_010004 [Coniosporium uncinatum]
MKNPFKGFTIAVSGDFGAGRAEPNIRRWVENSGGKFTSKLTKDTTHLICTKEHWKKPVAAVTQALKQPEVMIVSYDWLEDSLMGRTHKKEGPYLWSRIEKERKKAKLDKMKAAGIKPEKAPKPSKPRGLLSLSTLLLNSVDKKESALSGSASAAATALPTPAPTPSPHPKSATESPANVREEKWERAGNNVLALTAERKLHESRKSDDIPHHHVYRSPSPNNFVHDVLLARTNTTSGAEETYRIRLFESDKEPKTYAVHVRFTRKAKSKGDGLGEKEDGMSYMQVPVGSTLAYAEKLVARVFRRKTEWEWEERRKAVVQRDWQSFAYVLPEEEGKNKDGEAGGEV